MLPAIVLRIVTPASIILALLLLRFLFIQIPKLKHIVTNTNYKIPIAEFQVYTKLYVITSLSGILTILISQKLVENVIFNYILAAIYIPLYVVFIFEIMHSNYFIKIWKSKKLMIAAYTVLSISVAVSLYRKFNEFGFQISAITLSLINWIPVLAFFNGIVAVKENAFKYKTTQGVENYQPTHEFLEFTEKQTDLSNELLDDYKRHDFHNFAFYAAFLFMITENSFNRDNSEFLEFQIFGLATYAIVNAYLYNWYGTSFDDFRSIPGDLTGFKSSVELILD